MWYGAAAGKDETKERGTREKIVQRESREVEWGDQIMGGNNLGSVSDRHRWESTFLGLSEHAITAVASRGCGSVIKQDDRSYWLSQ